MPAQVSTVFPTAPIIFKATDMALILASAYIIGIIIRRHFLIRDNFHLTNIRPATAQVRTQLKNILNKDNRLNTWIIIWYAVGPAAALSQYYAAGYAPSMMVMLVYGMVWICHVVEAAVNQAGRGTMDAY